MDFLKPAFRTSPFIPAPIPATSLLLQLQSGCAMDGLFGFSGLYKNMRMIGAQVVHESSFWFATAR